MMVEQLIDILRQEQEPVTARDLARKLKMDLDVNSHQRKVRALVASAVEIGYPIVGSVYGYEIARTEQAKNDEVDRLVRQATALLIRAEKIRNAKTLNSWGNWS
jgi:hypothetical protein